jgi:hypothetical protein
MSSFSVHDAPHTTPMCKGLKTETARTNESLAVQVEHRITAVTVNDRGGCCLKSGRASPHSADFVAISRSAWRGRDSFLMILDATSLDDINADRHGVRRR